MGLKIFIDVETTGVNWNKHSIHQMAGFVELDDEVVEEFNIFSAPHPRADCEPAALRIAGKTEEELRAYQPMKFAYREFIAVLDRYMDRYDKTDKAFIVGFNNKGFDDPFMRKFFELCGDNFFDSWFWSGSLDVMSLSAEYLQDRRSKMPSFKLKRVAKELGIYVEEEKLHDAYYDVTLTREIYRIVTGREIEL